MPVAAKPPAPTPAIDINSLRLAREGATLFSELTMRLAPGEKAILAAPSGYGKSTLLRSLLGFVPPVAGTIHLFGSELTPRSAWQLRLRMAYVDQEPDLGDGTVDAVLTHPFAYKNNLHLRANLDRIPTLMEDLLLPASLRKKEINTLSGGEKQRLALLSALLLERDILLLDEPTSALDQKAATAVFDLLRQQQQLTVLAISHDQQWVNAFDRIIDLQQISTSEAL